MVPEHKTTHHYITPDTKSHPSIDAAERWWRQRQLGDHLGRAGLVGAVDMGARLGEMNREERTELARLLTCNGEDL